MKIVDEKEFSYLKTPTALSEEPISEEVTIYGISKMIAKKTKFRIIDVEEVVRELCSALFVLLLQRKSIDLDGIVLRNRWNPLSKPRYIKNEDEYWTFGFFSPKIEFSLAQRNLYLAKDAVYRDEFIEKIKPYMPDGVESTEDILKYVEDKIKETSTLGKEVLIDENNQYKNKFKKGKPCYFDEDFHPTWLEYKKFYAAKGKIMREYWERKRAGEEIYVNDFLYKNLEEAGFKTYASKMKEAKDEQLQDKPR